MSCVPPGGKNGGDDDDGESGSVVKHTPVMAKTFKTAATSLSLIEDLYRAIDWAQQFELRHIHTVNRS